MSLASFDANRPSTSDDHYGFCHKPHQTQEFNFECGNFSAVALLNSGNNSHRPKLVSAKLSHLLDASIPFWQRGNTIRPLRFYCGTKRCSKLSKWSLLDLRKRIQLGQTLKVVKPKVSALKRFIENVDSAADTDACPNWIRHYADLHDLSAARDDEHLVGSLLSVSPCRENIANVGQESFLASFVCGSGARHLNVMRLYYDRATSSLHVCNVVKRIDLKRSADQLDAVDDLRMSLVAVRSRVSKENAVVLVNKNLNFSSVLHHLPANAELDVNLNLAKDVHCNRLFFGEVYVLHDGGRLSVYSVGEERIRHLQTAAVPADAFSCISTSHPRILAVCSPLCLQSFDLRSNNITLPLYQLPSSSEERIHVAHSFAAESHLFAIAGDRIIAIIDQRYPKRSLLSWDHMLFALPRFLCPVSLPPAACSSRLVAVGSRELNDVNVFSCSPCNRAGTLWQSEAPPIRLAVPDDMLAWVQTHRMEVEVNEFTRRYLNAPLRGLAYVPLAFAQPARLKTEDGVSSDEPKKSPLVAMLQLRDNGDIFYETLCYTNTHLDVNGSPLSDDVRTAFDEDWADTFKQILGRSPLPVKRLATRRLLTMKDCVYSLDALPTLAATQEKRSEQPGVKICERCNATWSLQENLPQTGICATCRKMEEDHTLLSRLSAGDISMAEYVEATTNIPEHLHCEVPSLEAVANDPALVLYKLWDFIDT